jgi:hypothetical protein
MARQRMTLDKLAFMLIDEFQAVRTETAGGFTAVRREMTDGLTSVRQEMADGLTSVRQEVADGFGAVGVRLDRVERKVDTALDSIRDHEVRLQRVEQRNAP